eukprot:TRINITY_DN4340_c0_g1_i1.p1 TRINITY_DN4340_c0_g1~~TRINITY_DN4340_c0_g1_i1.p1  ORF type:complete len:1136 (-),score=234.24 TRINITY_DN4340_c0_g1_i1:91-3498(-)
MRIHHSTHTSESFDASVDEFSSDDEGSSYVDELSLVQMSQLFLSSSDTSFKSRFSDAFTVFVSRASICVNERLEVDCLNQVLEFLFSSHFVMRAGCVGIDSESLLVYIKERESYTPIDVLQKSDEDWLSYLDRIEISYSNLLVVACNDCDDFFEIGIVYHSSVMDHKTFARISEEIVSNYSIALENGKLNLLGEPISAFNFEKYLELEDSVTSNRRHKKFWESQLSHFNINTVPRLPNESTSHIFFNIDVNQSTLTKIKHEYSDIDSEVIMLGIFLKVMGIISGEKYVSTGYQIEHEAFYGATQNILPVSMTMISDDKETWMKYFTTLNGKIEDIKRHKEFSVIEMQKMKRYKLFNTLFSTLSANVELTRWNEITNMLLSCTMIKSNDTITLNFVLCPTLRHFVDPTIETFNKYLDDITNSKPDKRHIMAHEFNYVNNFEPIPVQQRIEEVFESIVNSKPADSCVEYWNNEGVKILSYSQINEKANNLSTYIQQDDVVGIFCERNYLLIVAILGVIKGGGTFVLIDPKNPRSFNHKILSKTDVLLTVSKYENTLSTLTDTLVSLDIEECSECPDEVPERDSLSVIAGYYYKIGKNGEPVGIKISHANILGMVDSIRVIDESASRLLLLAPKSEIRFLCEIFFTILCGGTLIIKTRRAKKSKIELSTRELASIIEQTRTEIVWLNTNLGSFVDLQLYKRLSSLRKVFLSSGIPPLASVQQFYENMKTCEMYHIYGSIETCGMGCIHKISFKSFENRYGTIPIGNTVNGLSIAILDRYGNPVPLGTPGQIFLIGDIVADGFVEDANINVFINEEGRRIFMTGDLGRYVTPDEIEFVSYIGNSSFLNGRQISIKGLSNIIKSHSSIKDVAVMIIEGDSDVPENGQADKESSPETFTHVPGATYTLSELKKLEKADLIKIILKEQKVKKTGQQLGGFAAASPKRSRRASKKNTVSMRSNSLSISNIVPTDKARTMVLGKKKLVAYYSLKPSNTFSEEELMRTLKESIPHYAIPELVRMEELPFREDRLKIDLKALINTVQSISYQSNSRSIDFYRGEEGLKNIWRFLLDIPLDVSIGSDDSFFMYSAHSIDLIRLIHMVKAKFHVVLPYDKLMVLSKTITYDIGGTFNHFCSFKTDRTI